MAIGSVVASSDLLYCKKISKFEDEKRHVWAFWYVKNETWIELLKVCKWGYIMSRWTTSNKLELGSSIFCTYFSDVLLSSALSKNKTPNIRNQSLHNMDSKFSQNPPPVPGKFWPLPNSHPFPTNESKHSRRFVQKEFALKIQKDSIQILLRTS